MYTRAYAERERESARAEEAEPKEGKKEGRRRTRGEQRRVWD